MTPSAVAIADPSLPLLVGQGLPPFDAITPEQVDQAIPALLEELNAGLSALEDQLSSRLHDDVPLTWNEVMDPLQRLGERLRWSWGVVSHLNGVCNTPELRQAHQQQQGGVVAFGNRAGQSSVVYAALQALDTQHQSAAEGSAQRLDATQQRILTAELRDMQLRGVGLEGPAQEAFNAASQELAELATSFSNHVLDATNQWSLVLSDEADLEGLPASLRELLAQAAREAGDNRADGSPATAAEGPWRLGLDAPRAFPFLKYSRRRDLRERVYRAQVSRASGGELNNAPLIERILTLKREQAERLGFANWAEVSLAAKMADSVEAVERLLEELRVAAYPVAEAELKELAACAGRHGAPEASDLQPWDVSFWAEVLRREAFDLDSEALRPWFPLEQVLQGLFDLCQRLFAIRIEAADGEAPLWHPDVRFFRVRDVASGEPLAFFYLDG
jgi:oligopeptidase A